MQLGLERQQLGKWKEGGKGEWVELREGDATAAKSDGMPLSGKSGMAHVGMCVRGKKSCLLPE